MKETNSSKKSIRDIPIPSREQRERIDKKLIEAEDRLLYSIIKDVENGKGSTLDKESSIEEVDLEYEVNMYEAKKHKSAAVKIHGVVEKPARTSKKRNESTIHVDNSEKVHGKKHGKVSVDGIKITHAGPIQPTQTTPSVMENSDIPEIKEDSDRDFESPETEESYESWSKKNKRGYVFWIICGLIILSLFLVGSYAFSGATITIYPKTYEVALDATKVYLSDVPSKTIDIVKKQEVTISVDKLTQVDRKATGDVMLYNNFSTQPQKLIAGTRLETSSGVLFKLIDPVTIPGMKPGTKNTPGSVSAKIVADKSGSAYNVGFQDFKLPAYKGTDRYSKIFGRSKNEINNGYSGQVPNLSTNQIASTTASLKKNLRDLIIREAKSKESGTFIFVPNAFVIEYQEPVQTVSKDGKQVTLSITAKATAILFDSTELSKAILKGENLFNNSASTTQKVSYTGSLDSVLISFPRDTLKTDLTTTKNSYFTVTGTSTIYTSINESAVIESVSRLEKERALPVLKEITNATDISISIWPFWSKTLPGKNSIHLNIK